MDSCIILFFLVSYVGQFVENFGKSPSYSSAYYALKRSGYRLNFRKYEKLVEKAKEYGLIHISDVPILPDLFPGSKTSGGRRGRFPDKWLTLTERGEILHKEFNTLEELGLNTIVKNVKKLIDEVY